MEHHQIWPTHPDSTSSSFLLRQCRHPQIHPVDHDRSFALLVHGSQAHRLNQLHRIIAPVVLLPSLALPISLSVTSGPLVRVSPPPQIAIPHNNRPRIDIPLDRHARADLRMRTDRDTPQHRDVRLENHGIANRRTRVHVAARRQVHGLPDLSLDGVGFFVAVAFWFRVCWICRT